MLRRNMTTSARLSLECLDYFVRKAHRLRAEAIAGGFMRAVLRLFRGLR
jgi:hypothetical protein